MYLAYDFVIFHKGLSFTIKWRLNVCENRCQTLMADGFNDVCVSPASPRGSKIEAIEEFIPY